MKSQQYLLFFLAVRCREKGNGGIRRQGESTSTEEQSRFDSGLKVLLESPHYGIMVELESLFDRDHLFPLLRTAGRTSCPFVYELLLVSSCW